MVAPLDTITIKRIIVASLVDMAAKVIGRLAPLYCLHTKTQALMIKLILIVSLLAGSSDFAQQSPVQWQYKVTRLDARSFEIHVKAIIAEGWHIYSQFQPKEAIAIPTEIRFTVNPLVVSKGKPDEQGHKLEQTLKELDITQYSYAGTVDFVQKVTLKAPVKTTVNGTVRFQACTDKQCLPLKEETFSLSL